MRTGCAAPGSGYRFLQEAGPGLFGSADRGRPVPFELSVRRYGFIRYAQSGAVFLHKRIHDANILRLCINSALFLFVCFFFSLHVKVFGWQRFLLPSVPPRPHPGSEGEAAEGPAALPHTKDWL